MPKGKRHETPEEDREYFERQGMSKSEYSAYWQSYWKGGGEGTKPEREEWTDRIAWVVRDALGRFKSWKGI